MQQSHKTQTTEPTHIQTTQTYSSKTWLSPTTTQSPNNKTNTHTNPQQHYNSTHHPHSRQPVRAQGMRWQSAPGHAPVTALAEPEGALLPSWPPSAHFPVGIPEERASLIQVSLNITPYWVESAAKCKSCRIVVQKTKSICTLLLVLWCSVPCKVPITSCPGKGSK